MSERPPIISPTALPEPGPLNPGKTIPAVPEPGEGERVWTGERARLVRRAVAAGRKGLFGRGFSPANVFAVVLFAVFALTLFAALLAGTSVYKGIVSDGDGADDARRGTTLIVNTVRAGDAAGAVSTGQGPEGPSLVLTENLETGSFETRLYAYDGWIMQEYAIAGAPYDPAGATRVVRSQTFSPEILDSAVRVGTDQGDTLVALRSADAVAADENDAAAEDEAEGLDDADAVAAAGAAEADAIATGAIATGGNDDTEGGE